MRLLTGQDRSIASSDCRPATAAGILVALWLGHAIANFAWLKADTRPPYYDTAGHAITALQLIRLPFATDLPTAIQRLATMSAYPPLVYLLSAPFALVFWPTVDALLAVNTLFLGILFIATYGIASSFGDRKTGILAAFIVSIYPIIYGLARHYLLDVPLTAMVTLAIWSLVRTDRFERRSAAILCGLSLGLGMLTKWTFAIFVAAPVMLTLLYALKSQSRRQIINSALALAIGAALCIPWYVINLSALREFLSLGGIYGAIEGDPTVGTLAAWLFYTQALAHDQILLPLTLFAGVAALALIVRRRLGYNITLLVLWIAPPYFAFALFLSKDVRYTMPYLPAIAILTALGLMAWRPQRLRGALVLTIALYCMAQFVGLTWGLSNRLSSGTLSPRVTASIGAIAWPLYAETVHIASPPRFEDWQEQAILHDMVNDDRQRRLGTDSFKVTVLPNAPYFEANVFTYYALVENRPAQIFAVTGVIRVDDARQRVLTSDYVVAKTGSHGPAWTLQDAELFSQQLRDPSSDLGRQFELIGKYKLPDQSVAELYRRVSQN